MMFYAIFAHWLNRSLVDQMLTSHGLAIRYWKVVGKRVPIRGAIQSWRLGGTILVGDYVIVQSILGRFDFDREKKLIIERMFKYSIYRDFVNPQEVDECRMPEEFELVNLPSIEDSKASSAPRLWLEFPDGISRLTFMRYFSHWLRRSMKERALTGRELARRIAMPNYHTNGAEVTISRWRTGGRLPQRRYWNALRRELGEFDFDSEREYINSQVKRYGAYKDF